MLRSRRLVVLAFAFLLVLLGALEGRLFYLQIVQHPASLDVANRYQLREVPIVQPRGRILDAAGHVLAESLPAYDIELWRPSVDDAQRLSTRLAPFLVVPADELVDASDKKPFALLESNVADQAKLIPMLDLAERGKLRGVSLRKDFVRRYPQGELTGWTVGLVNHELRGVLGLERLCDEWLTPKAGERTLRHDGRNVEYFDPTLDSDPGRPGADVVLTLDVLMQDVVHCALRDLAAEHSPDFAMAIVTNPQTGDILALDQWPPLDPTGANKTAPHWRTRVLEDYYTPGSTFKPFIMAYALDRGVVHLGETIDCENGTYHVPGRHPITDTHPMGVVPVREVLVHSSNIGMIKIAQRLVPSDEPKGGRNFQPIIDQLHALGFGQRTGLGMTENPGTITTLANWHRNQTLTSVAFGYEIGVTAVQMATAYSAFCNGGLLKPLRLIKEVRAADGVVNELRARPPRRVISPSTTAAVLDMLRGVVDEGTGKAIDFPPVNVAGKSGTTTPPGRFDPELGRAKVASFVAFAPSNDPQLMVIVVARKEAVKGTYYGATVAGPAVREIISKGLALQGVVLDSQEGIGWERQNHAGY